jgi:hypothetical protein
MGDAGPVRRWARKNGGLMDFIERMFGISPDGGDGSTELMIITVFVLIAVIITWRWLSRRSPEDV